MVDLVWHATIRLLKGAQIPMSLRLSSTTSSKDSLSQGLMSACLRRSLRLSWHISICRGHPAHREGVQDVQKHQRGAAKGSTSSLDAKIGPVAFCCLPGRITVEKLAWVPKWSIVGALQLFYVYVHGKTLRILAAAILWKGLRLAPFVPPGS